MASDRTPVLLVPGAFGQDFVYWNVMRRFFERDDHPVYSCTFPLLTLSDLRASAASLREKVEDVKAAEKVDRVALVAHSMGGLIARYYARFLGGEDSVSRLVCMGVPHRGTWTGATFPLLRGTRQILPGSPFLNALNDVPDPQKLPVTNIYSTTDFIVLPPASAKLDPSWYAAGENHCAPLAGHWGMLVSPRVYRWMFDAISGPGGAARFERIAAAHGSPERELAREARDAMRRGSAREGIKAP